MSTGSGAERASSAAGKVGGLRARSLAGLFPRIESQRAWLDRHLTPAGQWLAAAGLVAALFGLDIGRTLCWQFAALALTWLLLALLLARLRRVPVQLTRTARMELRAGEATRLPLTVTSASPRVLDGLSVAELPSVHALPREAFAALYRRLAGKPARWVPAELAWTSFRHALSCARGHADVRHDLPPLKAGEVRTIALPFTALRRGEIRLPGLFLMATEPLGLARRVRRIAAAMDLLALPGRLPPVAWRVQESDAGARAAMRRSQARAEEEFRALRPYRPGDARRNIHWRVSARRGELVVRESSGGEAERAQVALACVAGADSSEAFEAAVQVAAACLEQRTPAPTRPTLLLAGGRSVQVIEATGARGIELQLRALARCEAETVGRKADLQDEAGAAIEAMASRLPAGLPAEWVLTLPLSAHHLHRLMQLAEAHAGLMLYLVGEDAPPGPRPPRARWLRPACLAEDWRRGGAEAW